MTQLYIANVSKHNVILPYYRPGVSKLQEPEIKSGSQICIEGEKSELETIIGRFRKFGVIEGNEVGRNPAFSGITYQWSHEFNIERLQEAVDKRGEVEDERAQTQREAMTAATDFQINQAAREVGLPEVKTIVEFEEKQAPNAQGKPVKQQLKIDHSAPRKARH